MAADPDRVATARALLEHLGPSPADLTDANVRAAPTVADYLPRVVAAANLGTRASYRRRMAAALGKRRIEDVSAIELEGLMRQAPGGARFRRNFRHGRHAGELRSTRHE